MTKSDELREQAKALEKQAGEMHEKANAERLKEQRARPLIDRLVFAAEARCPCGAGLAYDPAGASGGHPEDGSDNGGLSGFWDCSAIILGTAIGSGQQDSVEHTAQLPFAFYNIKSENQPSAHGLTTRPSA